MGCKKEREIMAVMTKPVDKAMITSEKEAKKMLKSACFNGSHFKKCGKG